MPEITTEEIFRWFHNHLEYDGYGWWISEICAKEGEVQPTEEEFKKWLISQVKEQR